MRIETDRLCLEPVREADKEDYFNNISHDKKVLETFVCRYAETLKEFDFSSYPGREDLLRDPAVRPCKPAGRARREPENEREKICRWRSQKN